MVGSGYENRNFLDRLVRINLVINLAVGKSSAIESRGHVFHLAAVID